MFSTLPFIFNDKLYSICFVPVRMEMTVTHMSNNGLIGTLTGTYSASKIQSCFLPPQATTLSPYSFWLNSFYMRRHEAGLLAVVNVGRGSPNEANALGPPFM